MTNPASSKLYSIRHISHASDFIAYLANPQKLFTDHLDGNSFNSQHQTYQWIFRGVSDSKFRLIPKSLRSIEEDKVTHNLLNSYNECKKRAELAIICEFYTQCHRGGLNLPHLRYDLHKSLLNAEIDALVHLQDDQSTWPMPELLPIFGLAQHYGIPTRLLDWSLNPFVAAFFAAQPIQAPTPTHLAVWILNATAIKNQRHPDTENNIIKIIEPPTAYNPNLKLQQGVFTLQPYAKDMENIQDLPSHICSSFEKQNIRSSQPIIIKLELQASERINLLTQLSAINYSASRIYDGFEGPARSILSKQGG